MSIWAVMLACFAYGFVSSAVTSYSATNSWQWWVLNIPFLIAVNT